MSGFWGITWIVDDTPYIRQGFYLAASVWVLIQIWTESSFWLQLLICVNPSKYEKEKNQPTKIKTSGSTFKNPIAQTEKKVWELIKDSVPLDKSFGDAGISEKHCNFFVNKGNAKFEDMKRLIDFVAKNVLVKTGVRLEKEIKISS